MAKPLPTDVVAPSPDKNPPKVTLDLDEEHVKSIGALKPGAMVKVVLVMEVTDISMREPYQSSGKKYVGSLSGEIDDMQITLDTKNVFAELAKSDMDEGE